MTNRLELNWKVDGYIDEQRYYCSETPFTAETKPTHKLVLASNVRSYVDTNITEGLTYYVAVGSVKNGVEKLSEVKLITTNTDQYKANVVALLNFNQNVNDETGKIWNSRNITYEAVAGGYAAKFTKQSARTEVNLSHDDFIIGTSDFTIEVITKVIFSSVDGNVIIDMRTSPSDLNSPVIESDSGNLYLWFNSNYRIGPFASVINNINYYHICLTRKDGVAKLWLGGQLLGFISYPNNITSNQIHLGRNMGTISATDSRYDLSGLIDAFRFTNGVARYTENFTPPSEFIY